MASSQGPEHFMQLKHGVCIHFAVLEQFAPSHLCLFARDFSFGHASESCDRGIAVLNLKPCIGA